MAIGLTTNIRQTGGGTVSPGTNITGFTGAVVPDKGLTASSTPRLFTAKFGDGYEQRAVNGINNVPRTFSLTFATRPKAEIDDISNFLRTLAGVDNTRLTIPNSNEAGDEELLLIVVDSFATSFDYGDFYSLTCQAHEVFEP